MSFAGPIWLIALLPWATLVWWALSGRHERTAVPFIELWQSADMPRARRDRALRRPPLALVCLLGALLLGVLAAAGPRFNQPGDGPAITIVIDRGITMSADPIAKRWDEYLSQTNQALVRRFGYGPTRVVMLPGGDSIAANPGERIQAAAIPRPTGIDISHAIQSAVADELHRDEAPVIVLSNQALDMKLIQNPLLIQIPPTTQPIGNVGLVRFAVRANPRASVMVGVQNQSSQTSAVLNVTSHGQTTEQTISLPARDAEQNYFVDLPQLDEVIGVTLEVADDLPADNRAWLVRQRSWPAIEAATSLPAEVQRMIEVYAKHRPASESSAKVLVTDNLAKLPENQPAIGVLGNESAAVMKDIPSDAIRVIEHPVTSGIGDWSAILTDAAIARPPGDGWTPLVSVGANVLIAVRERPAQQVWIGFMSPTLARRAEFVMLWTNAFNWVGRGGEDYSTDSVHEPGDGWSRATDLCGPAVTADPSPGVYVNRAGEKVAMSTLNVKLPKPIQSDWQAKPPGLHGIDTRGYDLTTPTLFAALLLLLLSAATWGRLTHRIVRSQGVA